MKKKIYMLTLICTLSFVRIDALNDDDIEKIKAEYLVSIDENNGKENFYRRDVVMADGKKHYSDPIKIDTLPEGYEKIYETKREMAKRIFEKHKLNLLHIVGFAVTQLICSSYEAKINDETKELRQDVEAKEKELKESKDKKDISNTEKEKLLKLAEERHFTLASETERLRRESIYYKLCDYSSSYYLFNSVVAVYYILLELKRGRLPTGVRKIEDNNNQKK